MATLSFCLMMEKVAEPHELESLPLEGVEPFGIRPHQRMNQEVGSLTSHRGRARIVDTVGQLDIEILIVKGCSSLSASIPLQACEGYRWGLQLTVQDRREVIERDHVCSRCGLSQFLDSRRHQGVSSDSSTYQTYTFGHAEPWSPTARAPADPQQRRDLEDCY